MKLAPVILVGPPQRAFAARMLRDAPDGWVMTLSEPTRTLEQNAKFYAMLSDISKAKPQGRCHTPDVWKALMMKACGHQVQFVLGIDGEPFPIGFRSSKLTRGQMRDLIEFMYQFGAENGVQWTEPGNA